MKPSATSVLISESAIEQRVKEMAEQISQDYAGRPITIVGILKGSFIFISDLIRCLDASIPVEVEFMAVSSYGEGTVSSGDVRIEQDINTSLSGKDVLLVEDIVDTGLTLAAVKDLLLSRNPKSVRIATLLEKEIDRGQPATLDYVGFRIPDVFVVGYGLDFAQRYRNFREIRILDGR